MEADAQIMLLLTAAANIGFGFEGVKQIRRTGSLMETERYFWSEYFTGEPSIYNALFSLITLPGRAAGYGILYAGRGLSRAYEHVHAH